MRIRPLLGRFAGWLADRHTTYGLGATPKQVLKLVKAYDANSRSASR